MMSGFKTKARAVELLGRKQIRDSVTALAELMKNAYDADAHWMRVEFNTQKKPAHLVVADRGIGMEQDDIENKWLVLGTNSKTTSKEKVSLGGRPLMGAKGIGRLASATIGKQLWMFTKTENSLWNVVFINWDIFENPYLSIEDIHIPTKYNLSTKELIERFDAIINELLQIQNKNLEHSSWSGTLASDNAAFVAKLYQTIKLNLLKPSVNKQLIEKFIRSFSKGTILFIDNLYDDWARYLTSVSADERKNDVLVQKMYNRFATFAAPFSHMSTEKDPFKVEIYIDGKAWDDDCDFTEQDYDLHDLRVEGNINHGIFTGKLFAYNADQKLLEKCNTDLSVGINVTAGILDWEKIDCGSFKIKFCHIEGTSSNSHLSSDDYNRIHRKLATTCGICIYRDGVRILPYGEPENDFLNIEERRTMKASTYIFSHRNIFGRIDIDSQNNPMLEDKSSREGLIENSYYFYFVKTLENLLIELALNYLSSVRKESLGLRASFIKKNLEILAKKNAMALFEKEEKATGKRLIDELTKRLFRISHELGELNNMVNNQCEKLEKTVSMLSVDKGYNKLLSVLDESCSALDDARNKILQFHKNNLIEIPLRYNHYFSEKLKSDISNSNVFVFEKCEGWITLLDKKEQDFKEKIKSLSDQWRTQIVLLVEKEPEMLQKTLTERLNMVVRNCNEMLTHIIDNSSHICKKLIDESVPIATLLNNVENYLDIQKSQEWIRIINIIRQITELKKKIDTLFNRDPKSVINESNEILQKLEEDYSRATNLIHNINLTESKRLGELSKHIILLSQSLENENGLRDEEQIIGSLRQDNVRLQAELDVYSDLANMGLAAEIVNNEFNQLFTNVNNAVKNMVPYVKEPSAKYWLKQIDMGFRSISDRQNQLSPMYRSYSLRKTDINLHDFIDEIMRFMSDALERDHITIQNRIGNDVIVYLSKSKVFPAISNLINNAMYWVLNSSERLIVIRYDQELYSLYIEDSGIGIKALDKESVFEPFVSYKPNGRGLGLTVSRKVLESQGYRLEIASEDEKNLSGACFKIVFAAESEEGGR